MSTESWKRVRAPLQSDLASGVLSCGLRPVPGTSSGRGASPHRR